MGINENKMQMKTCHFKWKYNENWDATQAMSPSWTRK